MKGVAVLWIVMNEHDVIIVGAGILGLTTAFHMLRDDQDLDLLMIERLGGPGRGNTAKSAAAYRDMFTSPVNRQLVTGSISFYEDVQERKGQIGLRQVGYLWLMTSDQLTRNQAVLDYMTTARIVFDLLEVNELKRMLSGFEPGDISKGILGSRCGILNQNHLSKFYETEVKRLGGGISYGTEVNELIREDGQVVGVMAGEREVRGTVVVATGAWMGNMLEAPVVPRKRQLFSIRTSEDVHKKLLKAKGFNAHDLLPFTILPEGAYLRPAANSLIIGYSDKDREPGVEDKPKAEIDFFKDRISPQLVKYFPSFKEKVPEQMWAGHYAYHPPDNMPFVSKSEGAILVGGASGSGVMKADSIGRVAAGLHSGKKEVELGDGSFFKVSDLGLNGRDLPPEELVI
jgi:glycine/D-amino acid oxidase-like deaminating enzyme